VTKRCTVSCLSSSPVCDSAAIFGPNGWMHQDKTWHAARPQPWSHCVRWGPSSPSPKGGEAPQFLAHTCCGQMAAGIKMPLGMEVGLSPSNFVLDWDPSPKRGWSPCPIFGPFLLWPNGWMHQDATWYRGRPHPKGLCVRWGSSPLPSFWPMSIVAKRLHGSRCHLVRR